MRNGNRHPMLFKELEWVTPAHCTSVVHVAGSRRQQACKAGSALAYKLWGEPPPGGGAESAVDHHHDIVSYRKHMIRNSTEL